MKEVQHVNVNRFGSGVIVEVIGTGAHDDVETRSYEFDLENTEPRTVLPRERFPAAYEESIRAGLSAEGYTFGDR